MLIVLEMLKSNEHENIIIKQAIKVNDLIKQMFKDSYLTPPNILREIEIILNKKIQ